MAKKFEEIAQGKLKRLIINMPPRHTKSEFASYLLPAWFLGNHPGKKVIQTSNTAELAVGFGRKVLQVFEECHLNFEHLPTGIDAMCVILPTASLAPHRDEVMDKISRAVSPDQISIQDDMAMLAIVGTGMLRQFGTAARLFTAIAEHGISIKTMLQTPSELSILIGIDEHDLSKAISALYDAFIRT